MRVLINGNLIIGNELVIECPGISEIIQKEKNILEKISVWVHRIGDYAKKTYFSSSGTMFAAGVVGVNDASFYAILTKLQDFAFYIAVGWATWGLIEYILDKPQGVERVKKAAWGLAGIYAIPTLFAMIRDTFRIG